MAGFLLHRRRSIYQEFYQVTSEFAPIRVLPISSLDPEKEHSGALTYVPLRVAYVPGIQNAARVGGGGGMVYWFHEFRRFSGRMDIVCAVQVASRRRGIHCDMQIPRVCVCVRAPIDIERRFKPLISPKYLSLQRNAITFRVPIPTDTPAASTPSVHRATSLMRIQRYINGRMVHEWRVNNIGEMIGTRAWSRASLRR